jgi:hypothetical protein
MSAEQVRKQIRDVDIEFVGRDSSVGIATCYELDGPGIESRRSQWRRPLRQGSDADRLLGLRVYVPPGSWMFLLCAFYITDRRPKPGQSRQRGKANVHSKNKKEVPVGERFYRSLSDRPWAPSNPLYNGYRIFFLGVKRPACGVNHPFPSSAEVEERVELYLYFPSGPS